MSGNDDRFDDGEGLDLTSEPTSYQSNSAKPNTPAGNSSGSLTQVRVHFRCCKVYWRFPIPADILSGAKESWFVHCPRCGSKLQLP
jgi:phage terminase large subunit GpA-like protein